MSELGEAELDGLFQMEKKLYEESMINGFAHMYAAECWGGSHLALGLTITVLSATVSASIFSEYGYLTVVAGVLSLGLVLISAVSTFLNPEQRANSHHKAMVLYQGIADKAQALIQIDWQVRKKSVEELCKIHEQVLKEIGETRKNSPRVSMRYYKRAFKEMKKVPHKAIVEFKRP